MHCIAMSPAPNTFFCIKLRLTGTIYIEQQCNREFALLYVALQFLNHNDTSARFILLHSNCDSLEQYCTAMNKSHNSVITMSPATTSFFCIHHQTVTHQNIILNTYTHYVLYCVVKMHPPFQLTTLRPANYHHLHLDQHQNH